MPCGYYVSPDLTLQILHSAHTACLCVLCGLIISPYNINLLVFISEVGCVYCMAWTECLNTIQVKSSL
jgi:hypothetical protein